MSGLISQATVVLMILHLTGHAVAHMCSENCTLKANLPCQIEEYQNLPIFGTENAKSWPGKVEDVQISISQRFIKAGGGRCDQYLNFSFKPPNDDSRRSIKGFIITQKALSYTNEELSLGFNLENASWTYSDSRTKLVYGCENWRLIADKVSLLIYPLPMPPINQKDKFVIKTVTSPRTLVVKDSCVLYQKRKKYRLLNTGKPTGRHVSLLPPSITSSSSTVPTNKIRPTASTDKHTKVQVKAKWSIQWIVVVAALAIVTVGLFGVILKIAVRRCWTQIPPRDDDIVDDFNRDYDLTTADGIPLMN